MCHLLKVLHEEAGDHRRQRQTHSHAIGLFLELAAESEVGGGQDMVEQPQDIILKMST
jgi:hypothetical protein